MLSFDQGAAGALPDPAGSIPDGLIAYKRTAEFNQDTIPEALLRSHATKPGVWGRICVTEGRLVYRITDHRRQQRERLLTPACPGVVEPEILHEVRPSGDVRFFVEFFRQPSLSALNGSIAGD